MQIPIHGYGPAAADGGRITVATLGPALQLKKNVFQGVVLGVHECERERGTAATTMAQIKSIPRLRRFQHFPMAYRIRSRSTLHPSALREAANATPERDSEQKERDGTGSGSQHKPYRPVNDPALLEDWDDDEEFGVGDRLLHVLQRWQVENVVLVVARQDASLSGRLIGRELCKLMIESAKLALEAYYVANMKPTDAAKLELFEATGGAAYIQTPRLDTDEEQQQQQSRPRATVAPAVCLLTSDNVPSWPKHHQPTSDGGGRKIAKKGRVNHFLHDRGGGPPEKQVDSSNPSLGALSAAVANPVDWLGVTRDEWLQLRSIRVPVKELHYLFMGLVVLVDTPTDRQPPQPMDRAGEAAFTPPSYSWNRCRDVLQQVAAGVHDQVLRHLRGASLTKSQAILLRALFQEPSLNEPALVRVSVASVKIYTWLRRVLDEYDEHALGIIPGRTVVPLSPPPSPSKQQEIDAVNAVEQDPATAEATAAATAATSATPRSGRRDTENSEVESALARELNALLQAPGKRIIDRGRLVAHNSPTKKKK